MNRITTVLLSALACIVAHKIENHKQSEPKRRPYPDPDRVKPNLGVRSTTVPQSYIDHNKGAWDSNLYNNITIVQD